MGRGGAIYLSYTALVLLSTVHTTRGDSIWAVSIDESPAPAPEDGPPFSAHATRNPAYLPYEIIGIVGAYFAAVFIIGTLLLTVGRSSRKRAIEMSSSRATEMVKPAGVMYDPSPVSPASGRSWFRSPTKGGGRKGASASVKSGRSGASDFGSPGMDSVVSFDQNVVEQDRIRREQEMERLYAAVMAQDDRKSGQTIATARELEVPTIAPPRYQQGQPRPPRLITAAPELRHLQAEQPVRSPRSPGPPKSPVRAIYPPDSPLPPMPTSPTSPIRADYPPSTPLSPQVFDGSQQHQSGDLRTNRDSRHSSFGSTSSTIPGTKKARRSLRHLKISAPLQSHNDDNSDGARTPLSPRFYTDPGIPPEPPTARTLDSQYAPTTAGTLRSWHQDEEEVDQVRDLPRPHLTRAPSSSTGVPKSATATVSPIGTTTSAGTAQPRPLPLRQLALQQQAHHQQQTQQQQQSTTTFPKRQTPTEFFPLSPSRWTSPTTRNHESPYPLSAGPVKTTFLDVRRDQFSSGPRTGVATPYSPYMPFTPLTPVTPRLVSRAERKVREREERKVRGRPTEGDLVEDEGEVWGSGY